MAYLNTVDWQPADGLHLEESAMDAVTLPGNSLVVAGPGAGKTELLAQRASYLLQTNTCKNPRRILAISFKRDAAANLKQRVLLRCEPVLASRFDSMTFDAFAKQLLDRFKSALPQNFRIDDGYELLFNDMAIQELYRDLNNDVYHTEDRRMLVNLLTAHPYPLPQQTELQKLAASIHDILFRYKPARLSFPMVMRLAQLIITRNPKIRQYLRATYQYVFLDEFQDTTHVQFDFLKTCFSDEGGETTLTAVGDDKQRIMLWANARADVFEAFSNELDSRRLNLQMNFRSAPNLVALMNHLIQNLLHSTDTITASDKWPEDAGEVFLYVLQNPDAEKRFLFDSVSTWMTEQDLKPRDIAILVKQQPSRYAGEIVEYFNANGIKARDESILQDLLTEELVLYITNFLSCLYKARPPKEREKVFQFLSVVNSEFEENELQRLNKRLVYFLSDVKKKYPTETLTPDLLALLIDEIIGFANLHKIKAVYPAYKDAKYADELITRCKTYLQTYLEQTGSILEAVETLIGADCLPAMTVHKSKGLEYHTVIFVGLEDDAFWTFTSQEDEDKRTFFVALSRAKERVLFTFCKQRKDKRGSLRLQKITNIYVLFENLEKSGVVKILEEN